MSVNQPMNQPAPSVRTRFASDNISNSVFWIPFAYFYKVRLGTIPKLLSWMLIYIMPTAYFSLIDCISVFDTFKLWGFWGVNYTLILLSVFTIYEIGYIHNDTFATKKENQPAIRLYPHNLDYFYKHWRGILGIRLFIAILAIGGLLYNNHFSKELINTIISIALILPIFLLYNSFRSHYNAFLYPFLVLSRYLPFLTIYGDKYEIYLFYFIVFPLEISLERFSMPKYRFAFMQDLIPNEESKTRFRALYYVATSILITLASLFVVNYWLLYLPPFYILTIYRLALWIIVQFHKPKNYLQG